MLSLIVCLSHFVSSVLKALCVIASVCISILDALSLEEVNPLLKQSLLTIADNV